MILDGLDGLDGLPCHLGSFSLCFKAGMDKIVLVWCAQSGKNLGALRGHTQPVTCLCWQPLHVAEGDSFPLLATSSKDAAVRIWVPRIEDLFTFK